jgi:peptidoglycan hydrolase-like protein with peptidoglycan-binding domain
MKYSNLIYLIQRGLIADGFSPGKADGLRGAKTSAAYAAFLRSKEEIKPAGPKAPSAITAAKNAAFGEAGSPPMEMFRPPYPMEFSWNGSPVSKIGCHKVIAGPLKAALLDIAARGPKWIKEHGLNLYAGCFNNRSVRGGSTPSDHAWAVAIDINPDANGNHTTWEPGKLASNGTKQMPEAAVKIFRKHGFQVGFQRSNGTRRDMMHVAYINRR